MYITHGLNTNIVKTTVNTNMLSTNFTNAFCKTSIRENISR